MAIVNGGTGGGGGGGSAAFVGAEIYLPGVAPIVFSSAGPQTIALNTVQFDTSAIADLPNNQLVIPAGKAGYWGYGFTCAIGSTVAAAVVQGTVSVGGAAWNLNDSGTGLQMGLACYALDVFGVGDSISLLINVSQATDISSLSSGAPMRLFAQYFGAV